MSNFSIIRALTAMKKKKTDAVSDEIIPGLYLGSVGAALADKELKKLGITHIKL